MNQMSFNVLRRAQDNTRETDGLELFFSEKGIDFKAVQQDPGYYEDLIMEYSRRCINTGLYEESRAHLESEFDRLCEFYRRHEEELVQKFFNITSESILRNVNENNHEK